MHARTQIEISPGELAGRASFTLGDILIEPALHCIQGPNGVAGMEKRVMLVLLALAERPGQVQSRDHLLDRCWPGVIVGQDSLSRAIAEVRRALETAGSVAIGVETIPKSGYRLTMRAQDAPLAAARPITDRRRLLAGGVALAGLAAAGGWYATSPRRRAGALFQQAETALARDDFAGAAQAEQLFEEALALDPDNARGWGRLALARNLLRESGTFASAEDGTDRDPAITRALLLDPNQPDALCARAVNRTGYGRWTEARAALAEVVRRFPGQSQAAAEALAYLQECTGEVQAAAHRIVQLFRLRPTPAARRLAAQYLWSAGDVDQLGRILDRTDGAQDMAHVWYLALTGHTAAAIAHLDGSREAATFPPPVRSAIRATLIARESGSAADRANAIDAAMRIAGKGHFGTSLAIAQLGTIAATDEAFTVAEGYYLERGPVRITYNSAVWSPDRAAEMVRRTTRPLFMAQTQPLRADRRFEALVGEMGLDAYWKAAGIIPDYRRTRKARM